MKKKIVIAIISGLLISVGTAAQRTSFLDHLRIGFGAGVNLTQIVDLEPYNIYEDLTGETYRNDYSELFQNVGNQYFVQIEWFNDFLVINLKPGTYTHRFSKYSEVVFSQETIGEEVPYLLRYLSVPLEIRYHMDLQRFRPYAGITVAYSHLLDSHDPVNQTFIRPKIGAGVVAGTYTHRFSKYSEVVFSQETIGEEVPYLLRYLSVPLEIRYHIDLQRFRPYAGITASYSHLLDSNDPVNQTFIRPKIGAGVVAGTYIDLRYVILDLNAGYLSGLHNVASKEQRFETGSGASFAQDDLLLNNFQLSLSILFSLQKQKHYSNVECFY